ncbi:MAG: transporter [Gammaproteobacteria bacterium BRH_c0]|nr:MAG: transporter [Gammaproteobacteria bacterium BRH_c0]
MNIVKKTQKLALASAIALAMFASAGTAMASDLSEDITEARQESQIWTTYALSPYLRAHDLQVSVDKGKATLTGKVDEGVNKDLAKQIALGVSGIAEVDNQIVVEANYVPPAASTERSFGAIVDDASVTAAVKSKLLWSKYAQGLSVNVETRSGAVTLHGTANSAAARELAGKLALNTQGVVSVENKLLVDESKATLTETAKVASDDVGQAVSDTWVTTKVKSTLMHSSNINSSSIQVSTSEGVVTLAGRANSGAEKALAVELASNVRGVTRVDAKGLSH